MISIISEVGQEAQGPVKIPTDMSMNRIATLAQVYILEGPEALSPLDLYLVNKALSNWIAVAGKHGLTPRDVVQSILRPIFATREHCRCPSCQNKCLVCREACRT